MTKSIYVPGYAIVPAVPWVVYIKPVAVKHKTEPGVNAQEVKTPGPVSMVTATVQE